VTAHRPSFEPYPTKHGEEWLMRIGPADAKAILFVPPLFEEMNRTRALIAGLMRQLAEAGFTCILPDLPGTGESNRALEDLSWEEWRDAVEAAARQARPQALVSLRGGCLLDDAAAAPCRWRFAPAEGASLARDLERAGLMSGGGAAGYAPSPLLLEALRAATPAPAPDGRTARLASDRGAADARLEGPALWRRSEPAASPELAALMVSDIAHWIERCAGS
jgi:hypothetical protein